MAFLLAECTAPLRYGLTIVAAPIIGERVRSLPLLYSLPPSPTP